MEQEIKKLNDQIEILTKRLDALNNSATLPLDVVAAMGKRLLAVQGDASSQATAIYTQAVSPVGGVGSVDVAKPMTGFIKIVVNGNARNVPYY